MGAETVVTVVAVGLVVATVAISLIAITLKLYKVDVTLGRIHGGVTSIGRRTEPVGPVLGEIAGETRTIAGALTALVNLATGAGTTETVSMGDAVADARTRRLEPAMATAPPAPRPATMREAVAAATARQDGSAVDDRGPVEEEAAEAFAGREAAEAGETDAFATEDPGNGWNAGDEREARAERVAESRRRRKAERAAADEADEREAERALAEAAQRARRRTTTSQEPDAERAGREAADRKAVARADAVVQKQRKAAAGRAPDGSMQEAVARAREAVASGRPS